MNTFAQFAQTEDSLDAIQHAELQAYFDGSMQGLEQDFDRDFPFDDSQADEKHPGFTAFYSPDDVELFRMFGIVGSDGKNLFKVSKLNKVAKSQIAKIEKDERAARIAKYAAHYQNPQNEGITPIDSIFEQVEDGRDFHITPVMMAIVAAQDAVDDNDEDE